MPLSGEGKKQDVIRDWIWLAPIRILPEHLEFMRKAGAKNVVAVSTTSRFTKIDSSSDAERKFVEELIFAEDRLQRWAAENNATWTILRPTLIFGLGLDKNINVIAKFITRFHFFPILGRANGMRQPIHVSDVASACKAALESNNAKNQAYNISGAEIVSYREMVKRIFETLDIRPRFLSIPLWLFGAGMATVRLLPPFRTWSSAMVERMNHNMEFDHDDASRDFNFKPRGFLLDQEDLG
jgi:nucleoside-diphosphate-sugar epimerase